MATRNLESRSIVSKNMELFTEPVGNVRESGKQEIDDSMCIQIE